MRYVVTGTKQAGGKHAKPRSKFFECQADAERFADECSWDDVKVFRMKPVTRSEESGDALHRRGVKAAIRHLERLGYEILERDFDCEAGSVDVVAEDDGALVFIEVSTRTAIDKGFPGEFAADRDRLERIAMHYLAQSDLVERPVRFDAISCMAVGDDKALMRHHVNALEKDC